MSKRIVWDDINSRTYQAGVDRGVLYKYSGGDFVDGVAWNGLTSVNYKSGRSNVTPLYSGDDVKTDFAYGYDEGSGTIKAYTYPEEFDEILGDVAFVPGIYGRQQDRLHFGLCYRTLIGDTVNGMEAGYKLHLLYNLYVTDLDDTWNTVNDSPSAYEFSFPFSSVPIDVYYDGHDPLSEIVVDSRKISKEFLSELESILYGSDTEPPRMPDPDELIERYYVYGEIPESYEGYPYEILLPKINLYPQALPNPYFFVSFDLGLSSERESQFITQEMLEAGTYRVIWRLSTSPEFVENHLAIFREHERVFYGSDTSSDGEYTLTVPEAGYQYRFVWYEEGVTPVTTLTILIVKMS